MNRLDQIKHNLEHGLPIDVEETLSAIRELEAKLMIYIDMAKSHKEFFAEEGYLHEAIQIQEFIDSDSKQNLAEIQAKAIEDMADYIFTDKIGAIPRMVLSYANNLRQQAKEDNHD